MTNKHKQFENYLRRKNFDGCNGYLKKNISQRFKEVFEEELKEAKKEDE